MSDQFSSQNLVSVEERIKHFTELYNQVLKASQTNDPSFNDSLQHYSNFLLEELSSLQKTKNQDANLCQRWLSVLESQWINTDACVATLRSHFFERVNFELFPLLLSLSSHSLVVVRRVRRLFRIHLLTCVMLVCLYC